MQQPPVAPGRIDRPGTSAVVCGMLIERSCTIWRCPAEGCSSMSSARQRPGVLTDSLLSQRLLSRGIIILLMPGSALQRTRSQARVRETILMTGFCGSCTAPHPDSSVGIWLQVDCRTSPAKRASPIELYIQMTIPPRTNHRSQKRNTDSRLVPERGINWARQRDFEPRDKAQRFKRR